MPINLKTALKDSRLWIQSLCSVTASILLALALNGSLAAPTTVGDPGVPLDQRSAVVGASQPLREAR